MKKYNRGEITEIILSALFAVGVLSVSIMAPNALRIFKYFGAQTARERARIKRSVSHLEKRGFVKRKNGDLGDSFILTSKGEKRALRYAIENMRIERQKNWDGIWRIIMFDIPEEQKMARRAVNHALKKLGCTQYQKSVFITPFPCRKEIDAVGKCFEVRNHIKLIEARSIDGEKAFKRTFGL